MSKIALEYKTIILSDVHLGMRDSKAKEVSHFLKHTHCKTLILNGDIIDAWSLKRRKGTWNKHCSRFIRMVLKKIEYKKTQVIYLRGNHDDILRKFMPIHFEGFQIVEDHILKMNGRKYLVVHGDVFDTITSNYAIIAHLGDIGYNLLLAVNRFYNRYRTWRGKDYYSISKQVKARVKKAVNFISKFESALVRLARHYHCDGVICGHIHTAEDKMLDDIHYLNSGDWVESMTAIVETKEGELKLIDYPTFLKELEEAAKETSESIILPLEEDPEFKKMELPETLLTEERLLKVP